MFNYLLPTPDLFLLGVLSTRVFEFPKSYKLIRDLVLQGCPDDGIVLDSFAGSGTTAHAVLALNKKDGGNRKFILVECEDYADDITAERVRRVIKGVPNARDKSLQAGLGGSFTYCTLGDPIEVEGMLSETGLPDYGDLAAYLLYTSKGISAESAGLAPQGDDGLFYSDEQTDYHLLYRPDGDWLRSDDAVLNRERAERIGAVSKARGKEAIVYAPVKYISQRALSDIGGVQYCQLPYQIHQSG